MCAPSDDWTSLGLSLFSSIILTGLVSIDLEKRIIIFVGSCLVSVVSSSRTIAQKEHFDIHNVSAANLLPSQCEQVLQDGRVPDGVGTALLDKSAPPVEAIERQEGSELDEEGLGQVIKHSKCEKVWVCEVVRFAKNMVCAMEKYT